MSAIAVAVNEFPFHQPFPTKERGGVLPTGSLVLKFCERVYRPFYHTATSFTSALIN